MNADAIIAQHAQRVRALEIMTAPNAVVPRDAWRPDVDASRFLADLIVGLSAWQVTPGAGRYMMGGVARLVRDAMWTHGTWGVHAGQGVDAAPVTRGPADMTSRRLALEMTRLMVSVGALPHIKPFSGADSGHMAPEWTSNATADGRQDGAWVRIGGNVGETRNTWRSNNRLVQWSVWRQDGLRGARLGGTSKSTLSARANNAPINAATLPGKSSRWIDLDGDIVVDGWLLNTVQGSELFGVPGGRDSSQWIQNYGSNDPPHYKPCENEKRRPPLPSLPELMVAGVVAPDRIFRVVLADRGCWANPRGEYVDRGGESAVLVAIPAETALLLQPPFPMNREVPYGQHVHNGVRPADGYARDVRDRIDWVLDGNGRVNNSSPSVCTPGLPAVTAWARRWAAWGERYLREAERTKGWQPLRLHPHTRGTVEYRVDNATVHLRGTLQGLGDGEGGEINPLAPDYKMTLGEFGPLDLHSDRDRPLTWTDVPVPHDDGTGHQVLRITRDGFASDVPVLSGEERDWLGRRLRFDGVSFPVAST